MVDAFDIAHFHIMKWEGGLVDHPADPGGVTNYGISLRFAQTVGLDLSGDGKTTREDIIRLTEDKAKEIYRTHFWHKGMCDMLPDGMSLAHLDACVNLGVPRAVKLLQKSLRSAMNIPMTIDGIWGTETQKAVKRMLANKLELAVLKEMLARRGEWYASLDQLDDLFGLGWMRRLIDTTVRAVDELKGKH